jgi:hypothetical protein
MKPFQFYKVKRFPKLQSGQEVSTVIQLTLTGEGEDVRTTFTMEKPDYEGPLDLLRVKSEIKHETVGYIKAFLESQRRKIDFSEYLEPVDFPAYYATKKKLCIFQAPKRACRGVLANIRHNECPIALTEMRVNFGRVLDKCTEYLAAWFRGVSTRVHAAGLHGDQIQEDSLFKKLLKDGQLSNVTIPWLYESFEHPVMITSSGAIVLVRNYNSNIGLELRIVMDVFDKLLSQVWDEKKGRGNEDVPIAP